jgi:hypothetical protein
MLTFLKKIIKKNDLYLAYRLLQRNSYVRSSGWGVTVKEVRCIDHNLSPMPWITYSAFDFLDEKVNRSLNIFEYGSGSSTAYWASKCNTVVSVEHDYTWYNTTRQTISNLSNASVHFKNLGDEYISFIKKQNIDFDIILIDGRMRVECIYASISKLKKSGIIILDNSERLRYREGILHLIEQGFHQIKFTGMSPMVDYECETSIFFKDLNSIIWS